MNDSPPPLTAPQHPLLLLHGLWMHGTEMKLLARRLAQAGFAPRLFRYRTVRDSIATNAELLAQEIIREAPPLPHLVCHSLGGVVAIRMAVEHPELRPLRIVALGSPFLGSRAAQRLARIPLLGNAILRGAMAEGLDGTGIHSTPAGVELGVIAGTLEIGSGPLWGVPRPHDGTVAVAETRITGARAHLTVTASHMGLLTSSRAVAATVEFLRTGEIT